MKTKTNRRTAIVVIGGINTDYTIRGKTLPSSGQTVQGDTFYTGAGGKGANQAVAAARLGARVAIVGCVGKEPRGREQIQNLKREKIDTGFVSSVAGQPTGAAVISVNNEGEKQITAALGANQKLRPSMIRRAERLISDADVLLCNFEVPLNSLLTAAKLARKHGVKVILDPAPPRETPDELFPLLFAIRPNSDEAEQITGVQVCDRASARRAAEKLLARGVQIAVLQAGDAGNLLLSADSEEIFVPRMKVKAVDATGAGDAFAGGFAVGISEGLSLGDAVRLATVTAALSTTEMGAQEALPRRRAVEAALKRF